MPAKYREPRDPEELYDLTCDPVEMKNLAGTPEAEEVRRDLADQLTRWQEETQDPLLSGPMPAPEGARVDPVPW
jgi:hypothetical protein